jgi:hypothetical protein
MLESVEIGMRRPGSESLATAFLDKSKSKKGKKGAQMCYYVLQDCFAISDSHVLSTLKYELSLQTHLQYFQASAGSLVAWFTLVLWL